MKVRTGFVSNSSSSSFVIYGRTYKDETLAKALNIDMEDENIDFVEKLYEVLDNSDFSYHCDNEENQWYIGQQILNMNEDETLFNFKKRIEREVTEKFGNEKDDSSQEEFNIIDAVIGSGGELEW